MMKHARREVMSDENVRREVMNDETCEKRGNE
jgi:hypothetical protein